VLGKGKLTKNINNYFFTCQPLDSRYGGLPQNVFPPHFRLGFRASAAQVAAARRVPTSPP